MGLSLNELSSGAGGAVKGYAQGVRSKVLRNEDQRAQNVEARTQELAGRDRKAYGANEAYKEQMAARGAVDMPDPSSQIPTGQAIPTGGQGPAPAAQGAPALPEGGVGPPQEGAASSSALPRRNRRERYSGWNKEAERLAMLAGGIEGLDAHRKAEDETNRKHMYHYTREAEMAMQDNNAASAAKHLNTAMDVSPVDSGMEWVSQNGELYAKRAGKLDGPYKQEDILGLQEKYLASVETYKAFQELNVARATQTEIVRGAKAGEKLEESQQAIDADRAETYQQTADTDTATEARHKKYAERLMQTKEGDTLAKLINSKANQSRAWALSQTATNSGWTNGQIITLMTNADDWSMDNSNLLADVQFAFDEDPEQWGLFVSDVQQQMVGNKAGVVGREKAGFISQLIRNPGGALTGSQWDVPGKYSLDENKSGDTIITYDGDQWKLTPELARLAREQIGLPEGGGDKGQQTILPEGGGW